MLSKRLLAPHFADFDKLLLEEKTNHHQWHINYLSLLQQTNTSRPFLSDVSIAGSANCSEWNAESRITGYLSILEVFMDNLEQNLQKNLSLQLETEIGITFIEQAEKFFSLYNALRNKPQSDEGKYSICYFVATIALVGAVLERALQVLRRNCLQQAGLCRFDEYAELNQVVNSLEINGILEPTIAQQICFWLSLREKVLMNQPEQLNSADVKQMLCGTRELLESVVRPSFS